MLIFWLIILLMTLIGIGIIIFPLLLPRQIDHSAPNYKMAISIAILLPLFTLTLYQHWGSHSKVAEKISTANNLKNAQQEIAAFGSRQNIIRALRQKLEQLPNRPDTAKGWYILGKLYFNENNLKESLQAFQRAVVLNPKEPEFIFYFVSTQFLLNHHLDTAGKEWLRRLLTIVPNHLNAINLLALDAYQEKQYQRAIQYWESLLKYYPPGSDDSAALLMMIKQAQEQLPAVLTKNVLRKLTVTVDIAPALKNKVEKHHSLFVYALEAGGSRIPLAVVRRSIDGFPLTIVLDRHQSMLPGKTLDDVSEVIIEARVSKSGNALPVEGDLTGKSALIDLSKRNRQSVRILISKSLSTI